MMIFSSVECKAGKDDLQATQWVLGSPEGKDKVCDRGKARGVSGEVGPSEGSVFRDGFRPHRGEELRVSGLMRGV